MTEREILLRLKGLKRNGNGWMALCPAHEDHNPSLSINASVEGRVLLYCFAGCSLERVTGALGIDWRGLSSHQTCDPGNAAGQVSHQSAGKPRRIVSTYDYTDEQGELLFQVVRYEP